ncbi:MAG TPA: fibronectin type III domain-containing protein [Candidatus Thermoplasmatota archaeon]|nr:fibronectin type III domain-containing protein [Candidatus Thermoplasmatota archaeon]
MGCGGLLAPIRRLASWLCLLTVPLALPAASAHYAEAVAGDHGAIDVARGPGACIVWVEGRHLDAQAGLVVVWSASTDEALLVMPFEGEAEADGEGFRASTGPLWFGQDEAPGVAELLWWDGEEEHSVLAPLDLSGCGDGAPACPSGVAAEATGDGSVLLTWTPVADAVVYRILRDHELFAFTDEPVFEDVDVEAGAAYEYHVQAISGDGVSLGCAGVTATAVPFFGAVGGAAAVVGGVAAFAWLRRR